MSFTPGRPRSASLKTKLPAAMLLAVMVSAACGSGEQSAAPPTGPGESAATTGAPAGSGGPTGTAVVLAATVGTQNFYPSQIDDPVQQSLQPMFESLVYRDLETGAIHEGEGRLAESWEVSPDFTQYTFHIRENVPFHGDWGTLTAEDVKWSLEVTQDEDNKTSLGAYIAKAVKSIETPDERTVVVNLNAPDSLFLTRFTDMPLNFIVTSKKYVETVGRDEASRHPIGTGPFQFVRAETGQENVFEAVPNHWRKTPSIQTLIYRAVPDASARLAAMKSGDAHLSPMGYDQIQPVTDAGLMVESLPLQNQPSLLLQGQYLAPKYDAAATPPWANVDPYNDKAMKVRRALSLAINRQEILDFVLQGRGSINQVCAFGFLPTNPGFDKACQTDPFDPDRAKALLAEAGYADPSQLSVTVNLAQHPARPFAAQVLEAVAQQWRNLGINVKEEVSEWSAVEEGSAARTSTSAVGFAAPAFLDAVDLLSRFSFSTGRLSYTGESKELDDALTAGMAAYEPADREAKAAAVFKLLYETVPAIPVAYADLLYAMSPNLTWPHLPGSVAFYPHNYENMELKP